MESIDRSDMTVRVQGGGADLRTKQGGDMTVAWVQLDKGVNLAPALVGLPGDLCQCPHWGYVIKGKIRMKTASGSQDFSAGQAFYWGPGHAPEALEDSEYVDVSPTVEFDKVLQHISGGG